MSSEPPSFAPESASDRWVDAALHEHARLGRGACDEELVLRVLRETVHRRPVSRRGADRRSLAVAGLAAAAVVAVVFVVFSALPVDRTGRRSEELSFVVRVQPGETAARFPVAAPAVLAKSDPSYPSLSDAAFRLEDLRITANHGRSSDRSVVYEGDVLVELAPFRIEAASVRLATAENVGDMEAPLLADRVRVVRSEPACVAEAERLSFDPSSGRLVLTGVTRLETDKGLLARFDPRDRLVLSGTGFTVESQH